MAIIDQINCGKVIIFNSMLFKGRWAFCIDYNIDNQIVYRGLFGLRTIDKKTFLGFARIVDVFDYLDRELTKDELLKLRVLHSKGFMESCQDVQEYIDRLFTGAGIKLFVNPEGWTHANTTKR